MNIEIHAPCKEQNSINLLKKAILNRPDVGNSSKLFSLENYKHKLENRSTTSTVKLPGIHQQNRKRKVHEVVCEVNDRCSSTYTVCHMLIQALGLSVMHSGAFNKAYTMKARSRIICTYKGKHPSQ